MGRQDGATRLRAASVGPCLLPEAGRESGSSGAGSATGASPRQGRPAARWLKGECGERRAADRLDADSSAALPDNNRSRQGAVRGSQSFLPAEPSAPWLRGAARERSDAARSRPRRRLCRTAASRSTCPTVSSLAPCSWAIWRPARWLTFIPTDTPDAFDGWTPHAEGGSGEEAAAESPARTRQVWLILHSERVPARVAAAARPQ